MNQSRNTLLRSILVLLKGIGFFLACFVPAILLLGLLPPSMMTGEGMESFNGTDFSNLNIKSLILIWSVLTLCVFLAVLLFWRGIEKSSLQEIGLSGGGWPRYLLAGGMLGFSLIAVGFSLLWLAGFIGVRSFQFNGPLLLGWLVFFLVQPFMEELIFRGYILGLTKRYFGNMTALVVSSALFALIHFSNDAFSWMAFANIGLSGLLMGLLLLRTGSIWAPTGLHAAWNFSQGVLFGFNTSGIRTYQLMSTDLSGPDWLHGGNFGFEGSALSLVLLVLAIGYYFPKSKRMETTCEELAA